MKVRRSEDKVEAKLKSAELEEAPLCKLGRTLRFTLMMMPKTDRKIKMVCLVTMKKAQIAQLLNLAIEGITEHCRTSLHPSSSTRGTG